MNYSTPKTLFVLQSGGPTAVINGTLAGIIEACRDNDRVDEIYGSSCGFEGLLTDRIIKLSSLGADALEMLKNTPGSVLGGSRKEMQAEDYRAVLDVLNRHNAGYLLCIGGNGTMAACSKIEKLAGEKGLDLKIIGIPKTVDNDITGTDHTPGFASAAVYAALAVKAQAADLKSMRTFEQVRIIETMGRRAGWIAASSALARQERGDGPHLIYIPEYALCTDKFLRDVESVYSRHGWVLVVVSESIKDESGAYLGQTPFSDIQGDNLHIVRHGAAECLTRLVTARTKLRARAQDLGMLQRSFGACPSPRDRKEAFLLGREAVGLALRGDGGQMVTLNHPGCGGGMFGSIALAEVAAGEKTMPPEFYDAVNNDVTECFISWIKPLLEYDFPEYLALSL